MKPVWYGAFTCLLLAGPLSAQLAPQNASGVTMGHIHLTVKDIDAQKKFWIDVMGGKLVKDGPAGTIEFPGVEIMLRQGQPTAPPDGSIVNHFGFVVRDMPGTVAKWKAAGLEMEATENPNELFVHGPDGIR